MSSPPTTRSVEVEAGPDEADTAQSGSVNRVVFTASAALIIGLAVWAIASPDTAGSVIGAVVAAISEWFGWWYFLLATVVIVFVVGVGVSRFGKIKLGPEESKPQFGVFTWTAMLFAAGIGIDLMFFSVAEPIAQYLEPPVGDGGTAPAARQAVTWSLFHYGITGWAMYAVMGMALGYFAFRRGLPLSIRSALYPIIGRRIHGRAGDAVDTAAVLGTIFGIATSLGIGVVQLNYGLRVMFGVSEGKGAQTALIVLAVIMATISVVSGLDRGIRRLSELNVLLSIGLMLFVLVAGNPSFLLNGIVMNIGDYVSSLPGLTLDTMAWEGPTEWLNSWTLFFWAWWVAWAPFVGVFLARISRGRTIRQFVAGVLVIPFTFTLLWLSIFGNSALGVVRGGDTAFGETALNRPEAAFYSLLERYPGAPFIVALATLTGLLFYVTSADSGALVMGNFTSRLRGPMDDCTPRVRIFWSFAVGVLTLSMLFVGGDTSITTLQNATIIMGLPFSFVLALVMVGLWRALHLEGLRMDTFAAPLPGAMATRIPTDGRGGHPSWRNRLARSLSYPGARPTKRFIETVCEPALGDVCSELTDKGVPARCATVPVPGAGQDAPTGVELVVGMGDEPDFRYAVCPVEMPTPAFAMRSQSAHDTYYRSEVYLLDGSQGYVVDGFTREQLIADVLDHYERHLHWLHLSRVESGDGATTGEGA
jgi:choline/glycine/proline betaine transport protein